MNLRKKMVSLGVLIGRPLSDITSLCGQPQESKDMKFTDIGPGTRKTWKDSRYSITLNFDSKDICHGVAAEQTLSSEKTGNIIILVISIIMAVLMVRCCFGGSSSGSSHSASSNTCKSCGRTFQAGDSGGNYMNIAKTGMCKNCYGNYQWGKDAIGN